MGTGVGVRQSHNATHTRTHKSDTRNTRDARVLPRRRAVGRPYLRASAHTPTHTCMWGWRGGAIVSAVLAMLVWRSTPPSCPVLFMSPLVPLHVPPARAPGQLVNDGRFKRLHVSRGRVQLQLPEVVADTLCEQPRRMHYWYLL